MIVTIDVQYVHKNIAASHLVINQGRAAFIDCGTSFSVPLLLAALAEQDLGPEAVDYICPTHVHLDHAGGTGQLMQACPNAVCIAHPRGARHLVEPAKLIAGSVAVYGQEMFDQLYGQIVPVAAQRLQTVDDGQTLQLGDHSLEFIHTEGHARHHYCVVDHDRKAIFSGDTLGISYRVFDSPKGPFVFATTTPIQFDPGAWHKTLERIGQYPLQLACLTHFGQVRDIASLMRQLSRSLEDFVTVAHSHRTADRRTEKMSEAMFALLSERLDEHGDTHSVEQRQQLLEMDIKLNVMGLEHWLDSGGVVVSHD